MQIKSNISLVIGRLKAYRAGVPAAVRRAIAPERWHAELMEVAEFCLRREAGPDGDEMVLRFLALMGSAFFGNRSQWWMESPAHKDSDAVGTTLKGAWQAGQTVKEGGELDMFQHMTVQQAMAVIKEWVEAGARGEEGGKEFKGDDQEMFQQPGNSGDNKLVERVWAVFGISPAQLAQNEVSPDKDDAIRALTPHIVQYFAERTKSNLMDAETASIWLQKVLTAWTRHIVDRLPGVLDDELKKAWTAKGD